ncbi:glycosyltransferase family 4 protein, partial [bacterium]|nr:glycosyltransferase family 4 protein [bacterium]
MRVVLCAEFPLADDRVVGGIEEVARRLGGAMAARGDLDVHAVSFHGGLERPRTDDVRGVTVHRFPLPRRLGNLTFGAAERRATAGAIRRLEPDVVHPLGLGPKALGAADAGRPWVVSVNGIQSNEARTAGGVRNRARAWAFSRMEDAGLRRATDVIVPNDVVRGMLGGRLGDARVHRIENAVDERFFGLEPLRGAGRIVCVGRILPLKAPEDLIEAAARLAGEGVEFRIRFVGPPDDEAYLDGLRRRVRREGLEDRVEFLGFVSDERLFEELRAAAVLVHPSRVEVTPLSVMQAMAAGLP